MLSQWTIGCLDTFKSKGFEFFQGLLDMKASFLLDEIMEGIWPHKLTCIDSWLQMNYQYTPLSCQRWVSDRATLQLTEFPHLKVWGTLPRLFVLCKSWPSQWRTSHWTKMSTLDYIFFKTPNRWLTIWHSCLDLAVKKISQSQSNTTLNPLNCFKCAALVANCRQTGCWLVTTESQLTRDKYVKCQHRLSSSML